MDVLRLTQFNQRHCFVQKCSSQLCRHEIDTLVYNMLFHHSLQEIKISSSFAALQGPDSISAPRKPPSKIALIRTDRYIIHSFQAGRPGGLFIPSVTRRFLPMRPGFPRGHSARRGGAQVRRAVHAGLGERGPHPMAGRPIQRAGLYPHRHQQVPVSGQSRV